MAYAHSFLLARRLSRSSVAPGFVCVFLASFRIRVVGLQVFRLDLWFPQQAGKKSREVLPEEALAKMVKPKH